MSMREMNTDEVEERRRRHGDSSNGDGGKGKGKAVEKWYTFEHDGGYRQVQMQFLGAVRSHGESGVLISDDTRADVVVLIG